MGNDRTQTVAATIRAEMARRRISQAQVASHLGISQPSLSNRLNGNTQIELRDLFGIADALGVAPADLLTTTADASPGAASGAGAASG